MRQRIQEILRKYQLTVSDFAKIIGVNASGLSQLLSGKRNYPSMETILKIKSKYPEIRLDWLILGQEPMLENSNRNKNLFSDNEEFEDEEVKFEAPENELNEDVTEDGPEKENLSSFNDMNKRISKIILFYSDNTFGEYRSNLDPTLR